MGKKEVVENTSINRIKNATKESDASPRLISLWLDVVYTTVSSWNSNTFQPSYDKLNQIGELLQIDNRDLLEPQGRKNTGFAKALEKELQRLHKQEGMPYEVEKLDTKKGKNVKVNNPEMIEKLKKFAEGYKNKI